MAVLSHLQQGKANKIIAHELSMSESTVKVHVRNIMRKVGATNRTQAAYKARQMRKQQTNGRSFGPVKRVRRIDYPGSIRRKIVLYCLGGLR